MNVPFLEKHSLALRPVGSSDKQLVKLASMPKHDKTKQHQRLLAQTPAVRLEMAEIEGLSNAESEQCTTDQFWGLDKAALDMQREVDAMQQEEARSRKVYDTWQRELTQQAMKREELAQQREADTQQAQAEESMRLEYFRMLHTTNSSAGIVHYIWPSRPRVFNENIQHSSVHKLPQRLSSKKLQLIVHQSPKAVIAAVQKAMDASKVVSRGSGLGCSDRVASGMSKSRTRTRHEATSTLQLTGHPIFHWDQVAAIHSVLQQFEGPDGRLADVNSIPERLTADAGIKLSLRYTVLGSLMKTLQWDTIKQLFRAADTQQQGVTFDEFLDTLKDLTKVADVPLRWIQLPHHSTTPNGGAAATSSDEEGGAIARHIAAEVDSGKSPLVFALFRRGVYYLPACVESMCNETRTFCLRYLLSPDDDAQLAQFVQTYCGVVPTNSAERSLLTPALQLNGQCQHNKAEDHHGIYQRNKQHQMLRHAKTEEDILRTIFNLADIDRRGLIEPQMLLNVIHMPNCSRTVAISEGLRILSRESYAQVALLSLDSSSGDGRVDILEWIEFCLALKDYSYYSQ